MIHSLFEVRSDSRERRAKHDEESVANQQLRRRVGGGQNLFDPKDVYDQDRFCIHIYMEMRHGLKPANALKQNKI